MERNDVVGAPGGFDTGGLGSARGPVGRSARPRDLLIGAVRTSPGMEFLGGELLAQLLRLLPAAIAEPTLYRQVGIEDAADTCRHDPPSVEGALEEIARRM
jgi:hypothetical protein